MRGGRAAQSGACGAPFWEEPCISGTVGSGTVFFLLPASLCLLPKTPRSAAGRPGLRSPRAGLRISFLELQGQGAANINLVTPTHHIPHIIEALARATERGLALPIVYNCSGYEGVEALRRLDGLVDIYLPDFKYMDVSLAGSGIPRGRLSARGKTRPARDGAPGGRGGI